MVLVLLLAEAFVSMISNFKQVGREECPVRHGTEGRLSGMNVNAASALPQGSLGGSEKGKETLRSFVADTAARTAGKALSLVIVDQEKCFRFEFGLET